MALSSGGAVRQFCILGTSTTVACASENGPLWIFNWREGRVVSRMRDQFASSGARHDGPVSRLCSASPDHCLLASGDEYGFVALWDLRGPALDMVVRLHEGRVTGLQSEWERQRLVSTSADTYIILYDMQTRQVVERGVPKSCTDGSGVPNTVLTTGGEKQRHLLLVGGADGKLRVWSKDQGPLRLEHSLPCGATQPTQCRLASDGWQVVVGTVPADPVLCAGRSDRGSLLLFDLRRLGGAADSPLVARREGPTPGEGAGMSERYVDVELPGPTSSGVEEVVLVEEGGESLALCLMDGLVRAFDMQGRHGPLTHKFDFDILAQHDLDLHGRNRPCALAATGRVVFTATTAPSLGVWFRQDPNEPYGHNSYVKQPPPPMALRARFTPMPVATRTVTGPRALTAVEKLEAALEQDRLRLAGVPRMRPPFQPFPLPEDTYPALMPSYALQGQPVAGSA